MTSRWNPNSKWRKISEFISKVNPINYIPRRSGQNASRPSNVEFIDLGQDISNNSGYNLPKPVKYAMGGLAAIALAAGVAVGAYNMKDAKNAFLVPKLDRVKSYFDSGLEKRMNNAYTSFPNEGKLEYFGETPQIVFLDGKILQNTPVVKYHVINGAKIGGSRRNILVVDNLAVSNRLQAYIFDLDKNLHSVNNISKNDEGVLISNFGEPIDYNELSIVLSKNLPDGVDYSSILTGKLFKNHTYFPSSNSEQTHVNHNSSVLKTYLDRIGYK